MKPEEIERNNNSGDKNVMPSMVVRQQKSHLYQRPASAIGCEESTTTIGTNINTTSSLLLEAAKRTNQPQNQQQQQQQQFDQNGLIIPKRVPHHPIFADQPKIRDLNRELKFNQVRGNNVLDKKSELKRALEKLEETKRKKEAEQERLNRRTSLEMRLEERAERIAKETSISGGTTTTTTTAATATTADTTQPRAHSAAAADSMAPKSSSNSNFSIRSLR